MPNSVNVFSQGQTEMSNTASISVLIIDDSEVIRLGITAAMQKESDFNMIGNFSFAQTSADEICAINPTIVLMDSGNIGLIQEVRQKCPGIKFLLVSLNVDAEAIREAFAAGADGFCSKGVRMDILATGIKVVVTGARWAGPAIVEALLNSTKVVHSETRFAAKPKSSNGALSAREQEVLNLLVQGFSNTQIGTQLYLSPETIKTHVRHIMEKMAVRDRTQAAVEAVRRGLIAV
jgi:NarL family two-component system response regulator LiaR